MANWLKIVGTQVNNFRLGLTGVRLKDSSGNLVVRNTGDSADADVTADRFKASGNTGLVINSDSAGTGADWKIAVARPASGMTADWTLTLPTSAGSPTQVLQTDGSGNTTWVNSSSGSNEVTDTTSFAFGSSSTVAMFTLPANAVILTVIVIVDTAFDGTANLSIGITGNASKYVASTDTTLSLADRFEMPNEITPSVSSEALEIAYSAGGATVGAGRVLVSYVIPS